MPKKSNKTAHVLSLLTNGNDESSEENLSVPKPKTESNSNQVSESLDHTKQEIIIELQGSEKPDPLSNLVKSDLEKELDSQLAENKTNIPFPKETEENSDSLQQTTYSAAFISKFGKGASENDNTIKKEIKDEIVALEEEKSLEKEVVVKDERIVEKEVVEKENFQIPSSTIKSELYILDNFNDENKEIESMNPNNINPTTNNISSTNNVSSDTLEPTETNKELHNLAEDFMKIKAPEIMQNFNMCTCQECVYDVMTLALNHTQPLYTVTEKGKLFQKLNAYELQYGTDLVSQITKACITVKLNPRHPNLNKK